MPVKKQQNPFVVANSIRSERDAKLKAEVEMWREYAAWSARLDECFDFEAACSDAQSRLDKGLCL